MVNRYLADSEREAVERTVVGIAGAGGLGSNVAMHLVRAGVRRLVICDFDTVNESNLNRQFFFRDQLGMKKVEALGINLRRIEPDLELTLDSRRLDVDGVKSLYRGCDILVEALDDAGVKALFYNAFIGSGKPVIGASGLAGFGRSGDIRIRRLGSGLVMVGDGVSAVDDSQGPQSPRVGIAAAMQANTVLALILGKEI